MSKRNQLPFDHSHRVLRRFEGTGHEHWSSIPPRRFPPFAILGFLTDVSIRLPSSLMATQVMKHGLLRKWQVSMATFGLSVLSLILFVFMMAKGASFIPMALVFLAIVWLFQASISIAGIREDYDFANWVNMQKQRKKDKAEGKTPKTIGGYEYEDLVDAIERIMVSSGVYKSEDFMKNPMYSVSDHFTVGGVDYDTGNFEIRFKVPEGKRPDDLHKLANVIPAGLNGYMFAEVVEGTDATYGEVDIDVFKVLPPESKMDLHSQSFGYGDIVKDESNLLDIRHIPFGVREDLLDGNKQVAYTSLFSNHMLIGGTSGGGKSVLGATLILGAARTKAIILGIDLKRTELSLLSPRFNAIAMTKEEALLLLDAVVDEMRRRNVHMGRFDKTKLSHDDTNYPPIVVFIDEVAELLAEGADKDEKEMVKQIDANLRSLAQLSRAAGISLVFMTQSPKADIINTQIRNNLMTSIALHTKDQIQQVTILGDAGNKLPHITAEEKGCGWVIGEGYGEPTKFKALFAEDSYRKHVISRAAGNRPVVKWEKLQAMRNTQWVAFVADLTFSGEIDSNSQYGITKSKSGTELFESLKGANQKAVYNFITNPAEAQYASRFADRFGWEELDKFVELYEEAV